MSTRLAVKTYRVTVASPDASYSFPLPGGPDLPVRAAAAGAPEGLRLSVSESGTVPSRPAATDAQVAEAVAEAAAWVLQHTEPVSA